MSDPSDGLNPKTTDTRARQTLEQLNARWGAPSSLAWANKNPPPTITVDNMDREFWVMVGPPRGAATVYELEREP